MRTRCEIISQDLMPGLRALVSRELIYAHNLSQTEAAKLLGVSQPAVSQYLRQLRGDKARALEKSAVYNEIKKLCERLSSNQLDAEELMSEFCSICNVAIENGVINVGKKAIHCPVCASD